MELNKQFAFVWIIGYFVLLAPIEAFYQFKIIDALVHSIVGVGVAILLLFAEGRGGL